MQPTFARGAASASARFAASSKRASSASRFFPLSGAPQARRCKILTTHAWLSNAASIVGMWAAMRARNLSGVTRETAQYFTDPRRAFGHGGERTPKGVEATIAASGRSNEQRGRVARDPGGALDPDWVTSHESGETGSVGDSRHKSVQYSVANVMPRTGVTVTRRRLYSLLFTLNGRLTLSHVGRATHVTHRGAAARCGWTVV